MNVGAVACLRRIKNAIGVARAVFDHTEHSMLAGDLATAFAVSNGFVEENLTTPTSAQIHAQWVANNCQPNYRVNVSPNASTSCGPYKPLPPTPLSAASAAKAAREQRRSRTRLGIGIHNHDTMCGALPCVVVAHSELSSAMVAIDASGSVASGTSTNGLTYKVPGRVGDSPVAGAGSYADSEVGGCGATGDGACSRSLLASCLRCVRPVRRLQLVFAAAAGVRCRC